MYGDDREPVRRMLARDQRAFDAVFSAYAHRLAAFVSRRSRLSPAGLENLGWYRGIAVAATLAIFAMAWIQPAAGAIVVGTVVRADAGGLLKASIPFTYQTLNRGEALTTNQIFKARGSALVALEGGGTLRIAQGSVLEAHSLNEIELRQGLIYVDLPPGAARQSAFIVRTALGSIEHVGTQFEVATVDNTVRVRVREGKIRLRREKGWETAVAGTELIVPQSGPVVRQTLLTYGDQWSWVEALAPAFDIEDRQLMDFLRWAARETGRELDIADPRARELAERTRLHGSIDGLEPLEAARRVISTTTLRYDLHGDAIRVSSMR